MTFSPPTLRRLAYSMLSKDLSIVCHAVGFDPYLGFYHQPRFGRPGLALDLMEPFRPLIADSAVLSAINTRMKHGSIEEAANCRLGDGSATGSRSASHLAAEPARPIPSRHRHCGSGLVVWELPVFLRRLAGSVWNGEYRADMLRANCRSCGPLESEQQ